MRMIGVFEKVERIRHIGHLDIQRAVQRGLRRSNLPVAYSSGFNPHILVSFASALSTGACGRREIMDVHMAGEITPEEFMAAMNQAMPPELRLIEARAVEDRHPAMMALLSAAGYELRIENAEMAEALKQAIPRLLAKKPVMAMRKTKTGMKETDIAPLIFQLTAEENRLHAVLALTEREACKPVMLMSALCQEASLEAENVPLLITREQLYGFSPEGTLKPLETL